MSVFESELWDIPSYMRLRKTLTDFTYFLNKSDETLKYWNKEIF